MRKRSHVHGLALAVVLYVTPAMAGPERDGDDDKSIFNVVLENDLFAGTDREYTNGIRFGWLSAEDQTPYWIRSTANILPILKGKKRISAAVGQSMFAPRDLSTRNLLPDDRPYAGWLYGSVGVVSDTGTTLDNVQMTVGVVGPLSGAEQTQKFVHNIINSPHPEGWNNQLRNEPGLNFTYERKWRKIAEASPFGIGVDAVPHVGVNLGNIDTSATLGTTFRLGYDLPADYGPPRIRPSLPGSDFFLPTREIGGYLFTTVEGRGVARNIFLDGNTFRDSHSVDKRNFVGSLQVGAALTYESARLSYTHVFMTKEYETQVGNTQFGAVTLSMRF